MKIGSIKEDIKRFGKNYGKPIISIEINRDSGIEIENEKLISTLNKLSFNKEKILFTGNPFYYLEDLSYVVRRLLFGIEIIVHSDVTPKQLVSLTNIDFCVILNETSLDNIIKEFVNLSSFNRAYFLFNLDNIDEIKKIEILETKYNLSPIYILYNNIKNIEQLEKISIKNNWNITPKI